MLLPSTYVFTFVGRDFTFSQLQQSSLFVDEFLLQYKTVYKKTLHTKNVTVTLNLTDSLNVTESKLSVNLSRVLHTIQVGGRWRHLGRKHGFDDFTILYIIVKRTESSERT